ncbi:Acidic leucine-rich nuclear phosphoprotein 32 family member A, partial [Trichoplax sp. H2]
GAASAAHQTSATLFASRVTFVGKFLFKAMEKRIELERGKNDPAKIKKLFLDNSQSTTSIAGLLDEFVNLTVLSMNNVGLTSLKGFPRLPNLVKLKLSDNRISSGLEILLGCPNLVHLDLSGNRITELSDMEPLQNLTNLKNLDLYNCDVTAADGYREKVFDMLQNLEVLDGYNKLDEESDGGSYEADEVADEDEEEFSDEDDDYRGDKRKRDVADVGDKEDYED